MEAVQDPSQIHHVVGGRTVLGELVEQAAEHPREVGDLDVGAGHRAHRVLPAHQPGDHRIHRGLLLFLVLRQAFDHEPADRLQLPSDLIGATCPSRSATVAPA